MTSATCSLFYAWLCMSWLTCSLYEYSHLYPPWTDIFWPLSSDLRSRSYALIWSPLAVSSAVYPLSSFRSRMSPVICHLLLCPSSLLCHLTPAILIIWRHRRRQKSKEQISDMKGQRKDDRGQLPLTDGDQTEEDRWPILVQLWYHLL